MVIHGFQDGPAIHGTKSAVKVSQQAVDLGRSKVCEILSNKWYGWRFGTAEDPTPQLVPNPKHPGGKDKTYEQYVGRVEDLLRFCYLVGDYESAVLFDRNNCPKNPLPLSPDTLKSYLDHKCGFSGETLVYKGKAVTDPGTSIPVYCTGVWKCHTNIDRTSSLLRTGLGSLHESLRGDYLSKCPECWRIHHSVPGRAPGTYGSCQEHPNAPLLVTRGDVSSEPQVKKYLKEWREAARNGHLRKGNCALNPSEVRKLQSYLVKNSSCPEDFKLYVMILTGIKLFLRADELLNMKVEDFITRMFQVHPNRVRTLSVGVQGKSDLRRVLLNMFDDPKCPEFDLVLHLLIYVKVFDIKSGYLFPGTDGAKFT